MDSIAGNSKMGSGSKAGLRRVARPVVSGALIVAAVVGLYLSTSGLSDDGRRVTVLPGSPHADLKFLPQTVGGLDLMSSLTGPDAIKGISKLHITGFPIRWAEVAWYGDGRITVWIARGKKGSDAGTLAERMATRIGAGSTPFTPPKPVRGTAGAWTTRGFDQVHFFFARDRAVWWVSADPGLGQRALTDLLGAGA